METCICDKFQYGDEVRERASSWQYLKEGFMGTVFKCNICGCLWFRTMDARGLMTYIKSQLNTDFGIPSPSVPPIDLSSWSLEQEKMWFEFLLKIPKSPGDIVNDYKIPEDIIRILYFLFDNDQCEVHEWLNSSVILHGNIFIPIKLMEKDISGNKLRFLILEKLIALKA